MFTDESGVFHSAITEVNKSAIIIHKSKSEVTVGFAKKRTANKRELFRSPISIFWRYGDARD